MRRGDILIWCCCALFVGVVLTPTGIYEGVWKLATGKDAAAWVQAIGSILSIVSAGIFVGWQIAEGRQQQTAHRHEEASASRRNSLRVMRFVLMKIVGFEATLLKAVSEGPVSRDQVEMIAVALEATRSMLDQVALADLGDELVNEFVILEAICSVTPAQIRLAMDLKPDARTARIKESLAVDATALEDALEVLEDALASS